MEYSNDILWSPTDEDIRDSRLAAYRLWLRDHFHLDFNSYHELWAWSVEHHETFWSTIADFFKVKFHTPPTQILSRDAMPEARWFEGASLNYAEHIFLAMQRQTTALHFAAENGMRRTVSTAEMWKEVARFQAYYLRHGVKQGDRIAGYLPNIPEATFAFLAAVSI